MTQKTQKNVPIRLFNTDGRTKEVFKPIKEGYVGMYCCGPTVYNFAHIGNLRAYIFDDILRRMFEYNNYDVKQVVNITDVGHLTSDADEGEDKMLKGAKREKKTVWEIAKFYEEAFFKDLKSLNILEPNIKPRATEHIKEMIELVKKLEENGYTYSTEGNIYYDISKFKDYGKMARLKMDDLEAGARIDVDENKRNPHDFVLWFTHSKFGNQEMQWDSPWGRGFPGWHVECSAMSMKYLGEKFDIHCGGIDHIPVHHTNEIAQSEGATGKKWVNYWLHNDFLVLNKGKMAKSGESFITLQVLRDKGFDPMDYRFFCLGAHYRTQLNFSYEAMDGARNAFKKLKERVLELKSNPCSFPKPTLEAKYKTKFLESINNDINTSEALALVNAVLKDKELGNDEKLSLIFDFDRVLGLDLNKLEQDNIPEEIKVLAQKRQEARDNKDWTTSDKIRDNLKEKGYTIDDSPEGQKIKKL